MFIDPSLLSEHFTRSSGPGGQNVNKVATAVELRYDVGRAALAEDVKARLRDLAGSRITAGDVLRVKSREYRTQAANREAARARLEDLLRRAAARPRRRRPTRPTRVSREKRLASKKHRGAAKKRRISGKDED